jgi:hypothetical protein
MAKSVGKLLAERVLEARSPLYQWLRTNYAQIHPIIVRHPSWQALAKTAFDSGLRGTDGGPPSRQAVRKAWLGLVQEMEAESKGKPGRTRTRAKVRAQPAPTAAASPAANDPDRADDPPPRHTFTPAKIR